MNVVFSFIDEIVNKYNNKEVIIYGTINNFLSIYNYFRVLGLESCIIGFINEGTPYKTSLPTSVEVLSIYDLLYYKNHTCIILASNNNNQVCYNIDRVCKMTTFIWDFDTAKKADIIDPLLGYSRSGDLEGYVIHKHCDESKEFLKIMITGGSTTDDTFSNQRSWPSFLSEILNERKISHIIYNGGIVGYNSSQELLKIIRDINILKPHIVISYSGINDFYRGTNDFIHPYIPLHISKNIIPIIEKNIDTVKEKHTNSDMCSPTRIGYGLESYNSGGLIWYNNMTRMRAISVNENASFYGILQPTVFSDDYLLDQILDKYIRLQHSQEALNIIKENIKIAQRLIVDKKDIYSFEDIFKYKNDIFYDHCHCSEIGNYMIAKEVFKLLTNDEYFRNFSTIS